MAVSATFDPFAAVCWRDMTLCEDALTHSSAANERKCRSNERLEFLGDSVLDLLVSQRLMSYYPDWPPGKLSAARARLVCRANLGARARLLGMDRWVRLGIGADREGLREQQDVLGNALEALVGAAYLDGGLPSAEQLARTAGLLP
jgi:ribonuclease-3